MQYPSLTRTDTYARTLPPQMSQAFIIGHIPKHFIGTPTQLFHAHPIGMYHDADQDVSANEYLGRYAAT